LPKSTNSEYASSKNISWKRTGKPSLDGSVALHATEPFPKKLQMEQRKKRSSLSEGEWPSNSSDFKVVERVQLQQKEYQARKSGLEKISRSGKRRMSEIYYL